MQPTLRSTVRLAGVALAGILTAPVWLVCLVERWTTGGRGSFAASSELLSLFPGAFGIYLRRAFYHICLDACSIDCHIGFGTTFAHPETRIGTGVYIGNRCTVGKASIEDDVTIGSNVDILSGRHQHNFSSVEQPIQEQGGMFQRLRIGRNCWIGNSAVVMADVEPYCIIGAGSVVVHAIPSRSVAAGNPATVKRRRTDVPAAPAATIACAEATSSC
jgi:acetyltransferase-like isoleucine patch superfamily enzyme